MNEPQAITYLDLRPRLLDAVFLVTFTGADPLGQAIRFFKPGGSHTALGFGLAGSVFLAEALTFGFTLNPASERFSAYDGDIDIQILEVPADARRIMLRTLMGMLARKVRYGWRTLLALAWRKVRFVMGRGVCSQDAAYVLAEGKAVPPLRFVPSPGELKDLVAAHGFPPLRLAPYLNIGE